MQSDSKKEEKGKKGVSLMKWCHDAHVVHSFCE